MSDQIREMSADDYANYLAMMIANHLRGIDVNLDLVCEDDEDEIDDMFEWMIDQADVNDAGKIEDLEITPVKEPG